METASDRTGETTRTNITGSTRRSFRDSADDLREKSEAVEKIYAYRSTYC